MTPFNLTNFVNYLLRKKYIIYAPVKIGRRVLIRQILDSKNFTLAKERPLYPFKKYLLPPKEVIFPENQGKKSVQKQVLLGITIYDLRAVALLAQVFEKDPYFQDIISQTIFIGQSPVPEETTFYDKYEENVLEHLKFDIFLENRSDKKESRVFTGSKQGQRMLKNSDYGDFEHIEYAGAVPEEGLSDFHKITREKLKKSYGTKIWKELEKRCLGCDKCTIICPTCFCFKIYDASTPFGKAHDKSLSASSDRVKFARYRERDSCFNSEFSEISGGEKFLKTIRDRIYNWYDHKFVRIPDEYGLPGCVGCGRCSEVCPAGINIKEVIANIQKIKLPQKRIKLHKKTAKK